MTGGRSWLVLWYRMMTALLLMVLMGQRAAALLEMQENVSSSTEDAISNIALIPKVRTPIFPYAPVDKSSYRENTRIDNPFSNIPIRDLNNFFSHINPESEQTDGTSENSRGTIKLDQNKSQYQKQDVQRTCSQYMNGLEDATSTNSSAIEVIKYLCKSLGAESLEVDAKGDKNVIARLMSSDEVKSSNTDCKDARCKVIDWPKELRSLLYKILNSERSRPVRTESGRPRREWMSYRPINGRRDWRVLNEEYPGMMKQYINQFGVGQAGRRERHWGGGAWDFKMPL